MNARRFARQWILPFVDPRQLAGIARLPKFFAELRTFRRMSPGDNVRASDLFPCLNDRVARTPFDPHYFYQAAWLAQRLAHRAPPLHVDVGSSISMLAVVSAYQPVVFVDYRPLHASVPGLTCVAATATSLPISTGSVQSLSSLHVIEHIGLGRYGDPIDPSGSARACEEFARVLAPGGRLYLSAPVGRERVCFNAHRVFDPERIVAMLRGLRLAEFSLIDDDGRLHTSTSLTAANTLDYACGLFEFVREYAEDTP